MSDVFKGTCLKFISLDLELKVLAKVKELCLQSLNAYPTSLEEDYALLNGNELTQNQRNCVLYRSGEKEILVYLISASEKLTVLFGLSQKEAKKEVNKGKEHEGMQEYLKSVVYPALAEKDNK